MNVQKPWEPCHECVAQGVTCCSTPRVPFAIEDVKRIESATGKSVEDFAVLGVYEAKYTEGDEPWWIESLAVIDGVRYRANVRHLDGNCYFLVPGEGCSLGTNRPFVCRIYPFWVVDGEVVYEPGEGECAAEKRGIPVKDALHVFGETEESIHWLFDKIRNDAEGRKAHRSLVFRLAK